MRRSDIASVNRIIKALADYEEKLGLRRRPRNRTRLLAAILGVGLGAAIFTMLFSYLHQHRVTITLIGYVELAFYTVIGAFVGVLLLCPIAESYIAARRRRRLFARYLLPERRLTTRDTKLIEFLWTLDLASLRLARLKSLASRGRFEDNAAFAFGKSARNGIIVGALALMIVPSNRALTLLGGISLLAWLGSQYLETRDHISRAVSLLSLVIEEKLEEKGIEMSSISHRRLGECNCERIS